MATIYEIMWQPFTAWGNGYYTVDVNIPPAQVVAQVSLDQVSGGGTIAAGIKHYRHRLPSGADQDIDFGDWTSWPTVIYDYISSVTFALATGSDQWGTVTGYLYFWG